MAIKSWLYYILPLLVWFLLLILPFISSPPNPPDPEHYKFLWHVFITNFILLVIFYVHTYLSYPLLRRKHYIWYGLVILAVAAGFYAFTFFFNQPPMGFHSIQGKLPFGTARPPMNGPRNVFPVLSFVITLLCSFCYRVIIDNAAREKQLKDAETTHLRTELNFLRSQINPHFLFNILNNMTALARKKSDKLEPAIVSLAQLMRYMLYDSADSKVPLATEIIYLKSYINLQLLRFDDEVNVVTDFKGNYEHCMIDPMLLIPIVENAFKFGTEGPDNKLIIINLAIDEIEQSVCFNVMNFFEQANKRENPNSGIGLKNIQRRLDIVYPGKHKFTTTVIDNRFTVELMLTYI